MSVKHKATNAVINVIATGLGVLIGNRVSDYFRKKEISKAINGFGLGSLLGLSKDNAAEKKDDKK